MSYAGRWVVISGVRDLAPAGIPTLRDTMITIVGDRPAGIIFGGARGTDTGALRFARAAHAPYGNPLNPQGGPIKLVVIVPATVEKQPVAAAKAIRECADEVIELHLLPGRSGSYHARDERMLVEAQKRSATGTLPILVAFPGIGHMHGGTRLTIRKARALDIEVVEIEVPYLAAGA